MVLYVLTGSSCAGKSTLAHELRLEGLAVHDSDERGVPSDADRAWRHRELEYWVEQALGYQADARDLLLTGQSPLGEVLAAPSAVHLDGVAVCLIDVDDAMRQTRLAARDPGKWTEQQKREYVSWARWQRRHALDPAFNVSAIRADGWSEMQWGRWQTWTGDDTRWHTDVLDTTKRSIEDCVAELANWVTRVRADAHWPLRFGWNHG